MSQLWHLLPLGRIGWPEPGAEAGWRKPQSGYDGLCWLPFKGGENPEKRQGTGLKLLSGLHQRS